MKREDLTALGVADDAVDKIMSLHGADIEKQKNTIFTLTTERDGLKNQLGDVTSKLTGYDPDWKTKCEMAAQDAKTQIDSLKYEFAAKTAVSGLTFTSESAKKAFSTDLIAKNLTIQDDKLLGLDGFINSYKETDPGAFASDVKLPVFSNKAPGASAGPLTDKDKANAALREAFGRKEE